MALKDSATDPAAFEEYAALLRAGLPKRGLASANAPENIEYAKRVSDAFRRSGATIPDGYGADVQPDGSIGIKKKNDWKSGTLPLVLGAGGILAAGALAPLFAGGSGAASAGASAASTGIPAGSATIGPGVGLGAGGVPIASTAGTAAGVGSAVAPAVTAATSGIGSQLLKAGIGFGADALKTYLSNRASNAANQELQKGLAQARGTFDQAYAPYLGLGAGAAGTLGHLMGYPGAGASGPSTPTAKAPSAPNSLATMGRTMPPGVTPIGTAAPRMTPSPQTAMVDPAGMGGGGGSLATMGTPSQQAQGMTQSSFVKMWHPETNEMGDVPVNRVQEALQKGARLYS